MTSQPQSSGPLLPVTFKVTQSFLDRLQRLDNGQNRSASIRTCAEMGLDWFEDRANLRAFEAHELLLRAEALVGRWPAGRTAAGNYWAATPAQMPERLNPGEILATPVGVLMRLWGGTVAVDMDESRVQIITEQGRTWSHPLARKELCELATAVTAAVFPLATSTPGTVFKLPVGLALERIESGSLVITGGGHTLGLGMAELFAWNAELAGLMAGRMKLDAGRIAELNQSLAASTPEPVEVQR